MNLADVDSWRVVPHVQPLQDLSHSTDSYKSSERSIDEPHRFNSGAVRRGASSSGNYLSTDSAGSYAYNARLQVANEELRRDNDILRRNNDILRRDNDVFRTQIQTLEKAYTQLVGRVLPVAHTGLSTPQFSHPLLSPPHIEDKGAANTSTQIIHVPQLSRDDYPNVKYWIRKDWTEANTKKSGISKARGKTIELDNEDKVNSGDDNEDDEDTARGREIRPRRGGTQCAQGINVAMRYVEDESGEPVNGTVAASMRKHARSLWVLFAREGRAPASWGLVDAATRSHYHHDMRMKFPQLAFCHDNWKSDQIAIDNYPAWQTGAKIQKIKDEPGIERQERKRAISASSTSASKRSKTLPPSLDPQGIDTPTLLSFTGDEIKLDAMDVSEISHPPEPKAVKKKKEKANTGNPLSQIRIPPPPPLPNPPTTADLAQAITTQAIQGGADNPSLAVSFPTAETFAIYGAPRPAFADANNYISVSSADPAGHTTIPTETSRGVNSFSRIQELPAPIDLPTEDALSVRMQPFSSANPIGNAIEDGPPTITLTNADGIPTQASSPLPATSVENTPTMTSVVGLGSVAGPSAASPIGLSPAILSVALPTASPVSLSPVASPVVLPVGSPSMPTATTSELSPAVPGSSSVPDAVTKKLGNRMRPSDTLTPRNLCAYDWCREYPLGTTEEYRVYYDALDPEIKQKYIDESARRLKEEKEKEEKEGEQGGKEKGRGKGRGRGRGKGKGKAC